MMMIIINQFLLFFLSGLISQKSTTPLKISIYALRSLPLGRQAYRDEGVCEDKAKGVTQQQISSEIVTLFQAALVCHALLS